MTLCHKLRIGTPSGPLSIYTDQRHDVTVHCSCPFAGVSLSRLIPHHTVSLLDHLNLENKQYVNRELL